MKTPRVYADTSVFGGCFDDEFAEASLRLFQELKSGRFRLVVSTTTLLELESAPAEVRQVLSGLAEQQVDWIATNVEIEQLRDAYIEAGVVSEGSILDAEHIASASVADVDVIVSWNFKHIVHLEKIRGYHAVNLLRGYRQVPIHTPREVVNL